MPRQASAAAGKGTEKSSRGYWWQTTEIDRHGADDQAICNGCWRVHVPREANEALVLRMGQVSANMKGYKVTHKRNERKGEPRP